MNDGRKGEGTGGRLERRVEGEGGRGEEGGRRGRRIGVQRVSRDIKV